ncbi:MAG: DUF3696 domain-containing protein [Sphingobium limneticum]
MENFKAFNGLHDFRLAPLTILCGANSSGKSTFVQSLLLSKQTFEFSPEERVIALNGPLVRLGTFTDIVNYDSREQNEAPYISIGWRQTVIESKNIGTGRSYWPNEERLCGVGIKFTFDTASPGLDADAMDLQPSLRDARVNAEFQSIDETEHALLFAIARNSARGRKIQYKSSAFDQEFIPGFKILDVDLETKEAAKSIWSDATLVSCETKHFFPYSPVIRFDRNKRIAKDFADEIAGGRVRRRVRTSQTVLNDAARELIDQAVDVGLGKGSRSDEVKSLLFSHQNESSSLTIDTVVRRIRELPSSTRRAISPELEKISKSLFEAFYHSLGSDKTIGRGRSSRLHESYAAMERFFRFSMKYLGPLRADPSPLYPLQALASPTDVGSKGELTAAVLHLNARKKVNAIDPSGLNLTGFRDIASQQFTLIEAVTKWLKYLGIADDVETAEKGKLGHELRVRTHGIKDFQDLTNVGVGVSQVLPIVVTCLLTEVGSTTVLEQPELHLHPAVQARLADFFIAMVRGGKQVIIETHSEHIIERLRLRIVEDESGEILDATKIMFFETEKGNATVRNVSINEFGAIPDWPKDFFDQSQIAAEKIVMTALARRKSSTRSSLRVDKGNEPERGAN